MWVGEAPTPAEKMSGRVWQGKAGTLLSRVMDAADLFRPDQYITNLRKTFVQEGEDIFTELDEFGLEVACVKPSVIVAMGRNVSRYFLGDVDMEAVHGNPYKQTIAIGQSGTLWTGTVIPIYSPAAGLYDASLLGAVLSDVRRVAAVIAGDEAPRLLRQDVVKEYRWGFDSRCLCYQKESVIGLDTEGWQDAPWCLSYSWAKGQAAVIRANDDSQLYLFRKWLPGVKQVWLHNSLHDLGVLKAMGITLRDDQIQDTMQLAYCIQSEPQGLKALALRHLGRHMQNYHDLTFPFDQLGAATYLRKIAAGNWPKPEPYFDEEEQKVKKPRKLQSRAAELLKKYDAGGLEKSLRDTWADIPAHVRAVVEEAAKEQGDLGPMPPFSLSDCPKDKVLDYAAEDADVTLQLAGPLAAMAVGRKVSDVYEIDRQCIPILQRMQEVGMRADPAHFRRLTETFTNKMAGKRLEIASYNKGEDVNPSSSDQVATLLYDRLRLPVLKLTPGRKPSTEDKVLEALREKHPVPGLICDYREYANLRNNFSSKLAGMVRPDGRVSGRIRGTRVPSGRIAMSEPNLLGIPTRTAEGVLIRNGFPAPPGRVLASCDLDQIEMRVMASLSGDALLKGHFRDGRDVHVQTGARIFGVSLEEAKQKKYRDPAKTTGYGILFGISGQGLDEQFRKLGITGVRGQDMIDGWLGMYKGVHRFIKETHRQAAMSGYIRDESGRIRDLPGALIGDLHQLSEARRFAVSQRIQGTAAHILKRAQLRVWEWIQGCPFADLLLQIHDELLFECEEGQEELLKTLVLEAMTADSGVLLSVPITAKMGFGKTWGALKD